MTRLALTRVVILLGVLGLLGLTAILLQSWSPTTRVHDLAVALEVEPPSPGTYAQHDVGRARILLIREPGGILSVFLVPLTDGKVMLPDVQWWRPAHRCSDFRPETTDGSINADSVFECHDPEVRSWSGISWRWAIDGRHIRGSREVQVADLMPVKYEEKWGRIRIYRSVVPW